MKASSRWVQACALAAVASAAVAGCGEPDDALFVKAEGLYRDGRYVDAIPVLKEFLLTHPDHSGAHLYLGSCYTLSQGLMALAEGELRTALSQFKRDGKRSTIPRFSDEYFELRCHLELVKIAQFEFIAVSSSGQVTQDELQAALDRFTEAVIEAKKVAPDNAEVLELEEYVAGLQRSLDEVLPPLGPVRPIPPAPTAPPEVRTI